MTSSPLSMGIATGTPGTGLYQSTCLVMGISASLMDVPAGALPDIVDRYARDPRGAAMRALRVYGAVGGRDVVGGDRREASDTAEVERFQLDRTSVLWGLLVENARR